MPGAISGRGSGGRIRGGRGEQLDVDVRRSRQPGVVGGLWADRVELSAFAEQAVDYGLSDRYVSWPPSPTPGTDGRRPRSAFSPSCTVRSWPACEGVLSRPVLGLTEVGSPTWWNRAWPETTTTNVADRSTPTCGDRSAYRRHGARGVGPGAHRPRRGCWCRAHTSRRIATSLPWSRRPPCGRNARRTWCRLARVAEELPFDDDSFDVTMAMVTSTSGARPSGSARAAPSDAGPGRGAHLRRRRPRPFLVGGLRAGADRGRAPAVSGLGSLPRRWAVGPRIRTVSRAKDCFDGFTEAFFARPEAFVEEGVRRGQSARGFVEEGVEHDSLSACVATSSPDGGTRTDGALRRQDFFGGLLDWSSKAK